MIDKNDNLALRKLIMDHYTKPQNFGFDNDQTLTIIQLSSSTCSDELVMGIKVIDQKISQLKFEGIGCAISMAAADILANLLINKTEQESLNVIHNFELLLNNDPSYNEELLDKLIAFKNVYKQRNRIICATLLANGVKQFFKGLK